ncbi:MAG: tRNA 2-thiocytidine biosynthesis TtcA family protein [Clostridiales bacterium]|nr:tRNA 2-thiocytidine biosynthesis TtcA family protein [Clostridiales bacterium]
MKRVLGCIRRADERYRMIHPGDKICVGVSGGKDSLLLLYGLKLYQKFCHTPFELIGVMLDLGISDQDYQPVADFAESIGVPFEILKTDIGDVVFNIRHESHPCALCAKFRRGALNDYAHAHGCNLVALGHNRDDVIETFFMSLLYESRLNTFGPVTYLDRQQVSVIRPLIFLPEKYALSVAKRLELPIRKPNCPVAGHTKREEMKDIIRYFTKLMPDADERIMNAIAETHKYGMWDRLKLPPWNDAPIGIELFKNGEGHDDIL